MPAVATLVQAFDLLKLGEDNRAKLLWIRDVLKLDLSKTRCLFGTEEDKCYKYITDLFMLRTHMDCTVGCRGNKTSERSTVYLDFYSLDQIQQKINGHFKSPCHHCKKEVQQLYLFRHKEPLPFVVLDVGNIGTTARELRDFYTLLDVQYKVFAYTVYSTTNSWNGDRHRQTN